MYMAISSSVHCSRFRRSTFSTWVEAFCRARSFRYLLASRGREDSRLCWQQSESCSSGSTSTLHYITISGTLGHARVPSIPQTDGSSEWRLRLRFCGGGSENLLTKLRTTTTGWRPEHYRSGCKGIHLKSPIGAA